MSNEQASIMMSIRPAWCKLIASGKKTIEVRKTRPKLDTPFKCYIYCTKASKAHQTICGCWVLNDDELYRHPRKGLCYGDSIELMLEDDYTADNFLNGKVIGEFVCDAVLPLLFSCSDPAAMVTHCEVPGTCLSDVEIMDYLGNGKEGYGLHISSLKIYDAPKPITAFKRPCPNDGPCFICKYAELDPTDELLRCENRLFRAPQSWCYVRRKEDGPRNG